MSSHLLLPRFKRYKFYKVNLWGRLFLLPFFREKEVLYSRFNKRLTLKSVGVNPVKLRRKRLSLKGEGIIQTRLLKNYYHNFRESQFAKL